MKRISRSFGFTLDELSCLDPGSMGPESLGKGGTFLLGWACRDHRGDMRFGNVASLTGLTSAGKSVKLAQEIYKGETSLLFVKLFLFAEENGANTQRTREYFSERQLRYWHTDQRDRYQPIFASGGVPDDGYTDDEEAARLLGIVKLTVDTAVGPTDLVAERTYQIQPEYDEHAWTPGKHNFKFQARGLSTFAVSACLEVVTSSPT